jgi:hypothetical protein
MNDRPNAPESAAQVPVSARIRARELLSLANLKD